MDDLCFEGNTEGDRKVFNHFRKLVQKLNLEKPFQSINVLYRKTNGFPTPDTYILEYGDGEDRHVLADLRIAGKMKWLRASSR